MKKIGDFIKWFCYIATSIAFVIACILNFYGKKQMPVAWLWEILFSAFLTTLITIGIACRNTETGLGTVSKYLLHYIALCVVMILCGNWFGWLSFNLSEIFMMLGAVAGVYLISISFYLIIDVRQANEINRKLKEKYDEKE